MWTDGPIAATTQGKGSLALSVIGVSGFRPPGAASFQFDLGSHKREFAEHRDIAGNNVGCVEMNAAGVAGVLSGDLPWTSALQPSPRPSL